MTSKKYIIQPLSLPPPTRHSQNGSRTIALLAKNSKSLHALGPSDVKKRDKESNPSLPCSIGTSDQHKDLDHKKAPERPSESDLKDQPPPDLATDLKDFRNYLKNEKNVTPAFVTPFQNVSTTTGTTNGDDDQEQEQNQESNNGDFSAWIREMNTKLITKKRQIRVEKKRAEREKQSESTLSASPTSSPSFPKKQKHSLFQLRKKKTKKEGEYDTLTPPTKRETTMSTRTPTDDGTKTHKTQFCKPTPTGNNTNTNTGNTTQKSSKSSDLRLFQIVRPKTDVVDEEKPNSPRNYSSRTPVSAFDDDSSSSSSSSSSPSVISKLLTGKSKSFSFMKSSPRSPRTLAPSHHSEHDMRAKRLPRNVVSVSISSSTSS